MAGEWAQTLGTHIVDSAKGLFEEIANIAFGVGIRTEWAWRGVPSTAWRVQSTLVRAYKAENGGVLPTESELRAQEEALIRRARDWRIGVTSTGVADSLHTWALLQHHGVPTRLLDLTYNPMTALWFACRKASPRRFKCENCEACEDCQVVSTEQVPGVLLAVKIAGLDSYETGRPSDSPTTWGDLGTPGMERTWSKAIAISAEKAQPFVIRPSLYEPRMTAQEGLFLASAVPDNYGPRDVGPFDGVYRPRMTSQFAPDLLLRVAGGKIHGEYAPGFAVRAIIIPPELKANLRSVLRATFNRSERSMFPDLAGFAASLGERPLWNDPDDDKPVLSPTIRSARSNGESVVPLLKDD